jgi:hypothetical protein
MPKARGVTLLELVVASAMMGLLFFSGLQLLSTLFSVQARLQAPASGIQTAALKRDTGLRLLLQDAQILDITDQGRTLQFQKQEQLQTLRFKPTASGGWRLVSDTHTLGYWKPTSVKSAFRFEQLHDRLLQISLGDPEKPLRIWLRNRL